MSASRAPEGLNGLWSIDEILETLQALDGWLYPRAASQAAFSILRPDYSGTAVNDLPAHILSKLERRWASRLARDAAAWRHENPPHADHKEIVDRTERDVPVSIRRSPHPPVKTPAWRIG